MMCIKKKKILELLEKFPTIKQQFNDRAKLRRQEFRRVIIHFSYAFQIKRQYKEENNMELDSEEEDKKQAMLKKNKKEGVD